MSASPVDPEPIRVQCRRHGETEWKGHMQCLACRRVLDTQDAAEPVRSERCLCGAVLFENTTWKDGVIESTDAIWSCVGMLCAGCFYTHPTRRN